MVEELDSAPEGVDPIATALALTGASRAKADAFLDDQRHHMHEQIKQIDLKLWSCAWAYSSDSPPCAWAWRPLLA